MKLKKSKYLYFVYQYGILDYISTDKKQALDMAISPEDEKDRSDYHVERWEKHDEKTYKFESTIQKQKELK